MTIFMDIFVSIGCIIFTLSISQFLREYCRDKWPKELIGSILMEFTAAFELTAVGYELSVVFGLGGITLFAIFLFATWYWRTGNWHQVAASPCAYFEAYVDGKIALLSTFLVVIAQLTGGLIAYRYYTRLYWSIGLSEEHTTRLHEGFQCTSDIRAIPMYAAIIECLAVFATSFVAKLLSRVKYLDGVAGLINAFFGTVVVLIAFDISGGYMNPMLASSTQFGCTGSTLLEHLQVYWASSTFGTFLAYYLDYGIFSLFSSKKNTNANSVLDEKEKLVAGKTD